MSNNHISIKKISINGLRHSQVVVEGRFLSEKNQELIVYADGNKIKTNIRKIGKIGKFILSSPISSNMKKIEIKLKSKDQELLIGKINNNWITKIKCRFYRINKKLLKPFSKIKNGILFLWREHHFLVPPTFWGKYLKVIGLKIKHIFIKETYYPFNRKDFNKWIKKHEKKPIYEELEYKPLISILIPVYNIEREYLKDCLDSILNQKYENFEVCLADDCSTLKETKDTLMEYEEKDKRIKVVYRTENGHISRTTNSALEIAKGEFIGLMDDDDILTEDCLYEMVKALNENKKLDFIYSDEDKIDMEGVRCEPHFKSDFAPDSILGGNYICHFEIIIKHLFSMSFHNIFDITDRIRYQIQLF